MAAPRPEAVSAGAAAPATGPCRTVGARARKTGCRAVARAETPPGASAPASAVAGRLSAAEPGRRRGPAPPAPARGRAGRGQRWRRRSPGSLSVSRRRGRRDHGEHDSRQAAGCAGRLSCRGCGEHPVPAVVGDVIQAPARSASCVPVVSRKHRHADPLLPASLARERVPGFAVHNHVDHLCKTAPGLCAHWGNAGDRVAGPRP